MRETDLIEHLLTAEDLLPPLKMASAMALPDDGGKADAFLTARLEGNSTEYFNFLVETKTRSSPQMVHQAISQIRRFVSERNDPEVFPMIAVPYLSDERLRELEKEKVSGVDLCGNGVVTIPGKLFIYRTGNPNRFPESRPVGNPFQGKSAMVGRVFLSELLVLGHREIETLGRVREGILNRGVEISLAQVSKAVSALREERILGSRGRAIYILDPDQLMDRLAASWKPEIARRIYLKLPGGRESISGLGNDSTLDWAITGISSVARYTTFAQGGPIQLVVSDLRRAVSILEGREERVPSFADVEILESSESGFYFGSEIDNGMRWADRLQTWIELSNGDARQRDAARDIREQLIVSPEP